MVAWCRNKGIQAIVTNYILAWWIPWTEEPGRLQSIESQRVRHYWSNFSTHTCTVLNPEYSLKGLMLKLIFQYFGHLMWRADSLEKTLMLGKIEGRRRRWQRTRCLDGITNSVGMSLSKLQGDSEGQGSLVCCGPWRHKELDMTWWLNNNSQKTFYSKKKFIPSNIFISFTLLSKNEYLFFLS